MWGNSLGWGISAAMIATTAWFMLWLSRSQDTISAPTDFSTRSGAAEVISLPIALSSVLPDKAPPADAASIYQQGISRYLENQAILDRFAQDATSAEPEAIEPVVALLRRASGTGAVSLFAPAPETIVNYSSEKAPLTALATLGNCALNLSLRVRGTDKAAARADCEAAMTLGAHLYDERLCYDELSAGLGLMEGAAVELSKWAKEDGEAARADQLAVFASAIPAYSTQKLVPVQQVISSITQADLEQHAGDIFWLARNSKERMWRVESILKLGRYKFNAPTLGDNRGALKVVSELAQSEHDAAIKAAAVAARDLTLADYRMIH